MAAGTWKIYAKAKKYLCAGTIKLGTGGDDFRMALLRNSATALGIHTVSTRSTWNSIRAAEISARGGYAQHGRLIGPTTGHWTVGASAKQYKFSYTTAGLIFTASGSALNNIRFAVIMNSLTASTGKLLCFCTLSSSAFTISSPNTLTILPAATGVFTLA
jgi:hypothetical protein